MVVRRPRPGRCSTPQGRPAWNRWWCCRAPWSTARYASNAVPLTEDAVVHPDHAFRPAVELAEIEREVIDWREEPGHPATAVLRCAPVVAEGSMRVADHGAPPFVGLPGRGPRSAAPVPARRRPGQHDRAGARGRFRGRRQRGTGRVARRPRAPHTRDPTPRAGAGGCRTLRGIAARHRRVAPTDPRGFGPLAHHPWVVANDRLRGLGWSPEHGNDEAYVEAFRPAPWSMVSSSRRQELALGAAAATIVGVGGAVGAAIVRRRHR